MKKAEKINIDFQSISEIPFFVFAIYILQSQKMSDKVKRSIASIYLSIYPSICSRVIEKVLNLTQILDLLHSS